MNYTLHQLYIFCTLCDKKSISRTAEHLYLTQPAISIQLKKFQQQFDIPLTETIGKKIFITDFGLRIEEIAREILDRNKLIKETMQKYKGLLVGKLKIASASTGKYVIPYFLNEFSKKHESVEIQINVTNKQTVIKNLLDNTTDFALVSVVPDIKVKKLTLMENVLQLVCGPDYYRLGNKVNKKILSTLPMIYREEGSATRRVMEDYLESKNIIPNKRMELQSNEAVKQAVMAGLGVSVMPLIGLQQQLKLDLIKTIQAPGLPISTSWNLIWLEDKNLSPVGQAFIEHLQNNKNELIEKFFFN